MKKKIKKYDMNKAAKVGMEIICPVCGSYFIKKSYQQAFCCSDCKNRYWNQKRTDKGYFKAYNIEHPERLQRIGINPYYECDCICSLGDSECESIAQIKIGL